MARTAHSRELDEAEFRADPDAMLERVQSGCEGIVIKTDGRIIAALVNANLFDRIYRMQDRFEHFRATVAEDFRDIPTDEGTAQIDAEFTRDRWL